MIRRSLRRQLLLATNFVVLLVLALGAWFNYHMTKHELDEVFDAELAQTTRMIKSLIHDPGFLLKDGTVRTIELPPIPAEYAARGDERQRDGHPYERKLAFQVWSTTQHLLVASENAMTQPISKPQAGYHELPIDGYTWISFSYFDPETQTWIYTAQREDVRSELSTYITADQLWVVFLTWLPLSLAILVIVVWFLRPVRQFATQLQQRDANDLLPLDAQLPSELVPIQSNINALFGRINDYLHREKNFIADASHELRTPLAALKLHAAQIDPNDPASVSAVQRATERLTHLVNQLLLLTKLEGTTLHQQQLHAVPLQQLLLQVLADLPDHVTETCEWQLSITDDCIVYGLPTLLEVLFRNLLQNAAKYSGDDGVVSVSCRRESNFLRISVHDTGPGVPESELARLGERFFRHPQTRHIDGAGLGLSIVTRIAQLHGIQLSFANYPAGGLAVQLDFPLLDPS